MPPALARRLLLTLAGLVVAPRPAAAQAPPNTGGPNLVVIRDAETETLLRTFANPLFRAAAVDPNLVRIVLIRDASINSFVSTGNRMFIHTGMIAQAQQASELVGVIAHETGHIAGGHLARLPEAMRQAYIESIAALLIGAAAGTVGHDPSAAQGAMIGGPDLAMRGLLSFTRGIEASADQSAMTSLDANQWSARGLLDLFKRLQDQEALVPGMQDPYLQTHPLTRERIEFVQHHVDHSPYSITKLSPEFETSFQMVRAKLHGFLDPSSVTLRMVKESDPSPPARYARAIALYRFGHIDEAVAIIDGLLREQRGNPWLYELKGQVLFEGGRGRAAVAPYEEAARLAPEQSQIRAGLAHAMIESGDPALLKPAVGHLQVALARDRDDADSWHALGIAWGRLGNLGEANLALAEEALAEDDIRTARLLASKAEKLLPQGPARMRALDISNAVKKENREGF